MLKIIRVVGIIGMYTLYILTLVLLIRVYAPIFYLLYPHVCKVKLVSIIRNIISQTAGIEM